MNQNEFALLVLKGLRSNMDEVERGTLDGAIAEIRAVIEKRGDAGKMALGWVALEIATEEDKK